MSLYQVFDIRNEVTFFLANPRLQTVHKFTDVYNRKLTVKYDDLHELTISIPYKVEIDNQLVDNPAIALVRERFVVKVVLNDMEEYFVINQLIKSDNANTGFDIEDLTLHCFHLPYELHYKRYRSYSSTSYNCTQVTTDCLADTPWKVGYVNPTFNIHYRSFDLSSGNRMDFLNEISKSFNAVKTYDTKNRLVNFCTEDEISKYKGFNIRKGQYITGLSDDIQLDQMCTRLFVYGNNDLTINKVSPNGQSYIEDFSHFLYPFEMDSTGNVIQSSASGMSDALCKAIVNHGKIIEENQTTLNGYFNQITVLQQDITTIQNLIDEDNNQLSIVDDDIKVALDNAQSTVTLNEQRTTLVNDIAKQNALIKEKNSQIKIINNNIDELKNTLILENYLKTISQESLISELQLYIIEDEFTDSNIIDETDLYNEGLTELAKRNSPPVNLTVNIIDFLASVEESYNWDKLNIGDLVYIIHPTLGVKVKAKIVQIEYDFEAETITLGISNGVRILSDYEKFVMNSYHNNKVSNDYTNRKIDWQKTSYNFNSRNDRISETPADPSFTNNTSDITHVKNDDGSVTLTVSWIFPTNSSKNENNIDGFNVYLYASNQVEDITLGSLGNNESILNVDSSARKVTVPSVPANSYYYFGVQSYRDVDNDISANGILLSNIVTSKYSYPYQPEQTVNIQGRVNGIHHDVGDTAPSNPQIKDTWLDTTTNTQKIFTANGWEAASAGSASSLSGYSADTSVTPSTIPVRDNTGAIAGNITGDASTIGGKSVTDFAQLDASGKVDVTQIPQTQSFSSYTGDGTTNRTIALSFTPKLVKVFSTDYTDKSMYIPSTNGGYILNLANGDFTLLGNAGGTPNPNYGKLTSNGFIVGNDSNLYLNKTGVLYYYEAYF